MTTSVGLKSRNVEVADSPTTGNPSSVKQLVASIIGLGTRALTSRVTIPRLTDILACPFCLGHVEKTDGQTMECAACGGNTLSSEALLSCF